jgi:hypothetical protein
MTLCEFRVLRQADSRCSNTTLQSALCYRFTNQTPVKAAFLVWACAIASSRVSA